MKKQSTVAALLAAAALSFNSASVFAQQAGAPTAANTGYSPSQPISDLTQRTIQLKNGQNLGKLKDVIIDLVSGRTLYVVVPAGGTDHAVPAELFGPAAGTAKTLTLNTDLQKVTSAPVVSGASKGSVSYLTEVYRHFGLPTWWGAPAATGRDNQSASFGSPQWANYLRGRAVETSANAPLGKISNILIDLHGARVPFFLLTAQGAANEYYPIPPMAFSFQNGKFFTGIDQAKLQAAPKVAMNNWQQLYDPSFAAQVYQYYGKQTYWQTPTSTQPSSRVYPQNP